MDFDWKNALSTEMNQPYFLELQQFVARERSTYDVYPEPDDVFAALSATSLADTKVLILGQDPYHGEGQAHGLSFSVRRGIAIPPSLRNIFKELHDDIGVPIPPHGDLSSWAAQGVLLLNATLTVRAHEAASHHGHGWESFTDAIISLVNQKTDRCVFVLWGISAQNKKTLITQPHHVVIEAPHPSPLSARRGFFGSKPFSQINRALRESGQTEINWEIE